MRAADEAYFPLMDKGDKHRGKQMAVAEVNRTHMEFDNWLIDVESLATFDERPRARDGDEDHEEEEEEEEEEDMPEERQRQQQKSAERARFLAPSFQQLNGNTSQSGARESHLSQQVLEVDGSDQSSLEQPLSTKSLPDRKRLNFSESVEFRDEYRNYLEYSRSNEMYVPGRYAPPEEGYLDTSGAEQSALKFTGMKKVKGAWVEVVPKVEKNIRNGAKVDTEIPRLETSEDAVLQNEIDLACQDEACCEDASSVDARAERVVRRKRRASSVNITQDTASHKRSMARGGRRVSLSHAVAEIPDPSSKADAVLIQENGSASLTAGHRFEGTSGSLSRGKV